MAVNRAFSVSVRISGPIAVGIPPPSATKRPARPGAFRIFFACRDNAAIVSPTQHRAGPRAPTTAAPPQVKAVHAPPSARGSRPYGWAHHPICGYCPVTTSVVRQSPRSEARGHDETTLHPAGRCNHATAARSAYRTGTTRLRGPQVRHPYRKRHAGRRTRRRTCPISPAETRTHPEARPAGRATPPPTVLPAGSPAIRSAPRQAAATRAAGRGYCPRRHPGPRRPA